ncbi:MAG: 50S ribosomal protein L4 [Thermodesulfovibrionales bacterium]|nr:50S ribosomal protein L4 [Thermodesulfovibrionales bacterium]
MEIEIRDINNAVVGKYTTDKFDLTSVKKEVIHQAVVNYLANQRQGTHSTKTRGEVRGGGRKPWRQKHTGRARQGSIRSPLWVGGGIVFGPKPRDYYYELPKKLKRVALKEAIEGKISDNELILIDNIKLEKPKTKDMVTILKRLGIDGSVLIIAPEKDDNLILSSRNIPGVTVRRVADVNAYDIVSHDRVIIFKEAMSKLEAERI